MRLPGSAPSPRHPETGGCYGSDRLENVDPGASGEAGSQRSSGEQPIQGSPRPGGRKSQTAF